MQRFYHRAGVSVVAWRQSGSVPVAATLAPRDCHRRIVSRGNRIRISVGYTAAGPTSVTSDLAASYSLQGATSADAAAGYNVRAAVAQDASAAYYIHAAVTADLDASYAVLSAGAVQADLAGVYSVSASVVATLSASYFVDGSADVSITGPGRARIGPSTLRARHLRIGAPTL